MSRPLRIEFPGGVYHVTSRGDRREDIFLDDGDRVKWLALLGQVCDRFNWQCNAYCLMGNHFHIVVQTMEGGLSAGMRQLNGVYTQWHNRAHGRVGHLFQGRFKAILVQRDSYLLELARYVVLNPVRAGICAMPDQWPWSSYNRTIGRVVNPRWLNTTCLLDQFGQQPEAARRAYIDHARAGVGLPSLWKDLKNQLYLGDEVFAQQLQERSERQARDIEIPRVHRRTAAMPLAQFAAATERDDAMARAYATGCYNLREIGAAFGVHYATVSRAVRQAGG